VFKVKLSSNFFLSVTAIVALGVAGCGGSGSSNNGSGGKGGGTAGAGGKGTGGAGAVGGAGGHATGGAGGGTGGAGAVGGAGGGTGGAGAVGGSTPGTGGAGGGTGGAAGGPACGETVSCTAGTFRCAMGAPQSCQTDPKTGCTFWGTTPGQMESCSANQACDATTGTCKCNNDPACGNPPMAGDFCPTEGGATHSTCNQGADGCFTVTAGAACAPGTTCQTASTGTIVTAGAACGCAPALSDESGATVALNGTGCTMAQAAAGERRGSKADDAVLTCKATGAGGCYTWQITTSCASQQLTGGTDPVTSLPACVCKAPAVAGQYFVDPDPEMSTFMTGQPTGAQFPAACRFRTLTTAFNQTMPKVTEVIAQHTTSSNVHFKTKTSSPGVANCSAPNSCEQFPIRIPAGVHVYTSDQGSFNPAHYVIDVDNFQGGPAAVILGDKSVVEGYTIDASGSNGAVNAAPGVVAVVATPSTGAWTSTPAVAPVSGRLNQVLILAKSAGPGVQGVPSDTNQTAFLVQGQSNWQADYLSIIGGAGTGRGIVLDHATDPVAGTTAVLTATHLNVNLAGGTGQIDVEVGTNGVSNGVNSTAGAVAADAGNVLTVTNDSAGNGIDGSKSLTPHNVEVGAGGIGVHVFNGTATVTGVDVLPSTATAFVGYQIEQSNSPAAMGVNINQGSITGAGTGVDGIGILANGGLVTVNGTHISGVTGWTGISIQQPATPASSGVMAVASAGNVTLTGTAALPTLIDVVTPLGNTTATAGIVVGNGTEVNNIANPAAPAANTAVPRLTINDNTKVTNYVDGIVINNGHVVSTGANVVSTANLRDGLQVFSSLALAGTDPNDPLARVLITGASFTNNGRSGVLIRGVVPVALDTVKITGNGTPIANSALPAFANGTGGIDVQRSQINGNTGFLVTLQNSSISGNTGCGVTLSGGDLDDINGSGVRICGVGIGVVTGPIPGTPAAVGVFGGSTNTGGKVSAVIKNNHVQNNTGVGVYVTEARDIDPTIGTDGDITEVSLQNNLVTGNLTSVPSSGQEPVAGGIYFAPSDETNPSATGNASLQVSDIGCSSSTTCTRVRMSSFLGNTSACNGRAQLSFGIPQRISTSASGTSPDGDWDISSDGSIVGVDLTQRCSAAASPNTLAGYSANASSLGLAIPGTDLNAQGQSLIHVAAYGVKWNSGTIISGADYSAALANGAQGNGDAAAWGICAGGAPTTCPVALQ